MLNDEVLITSLTILHRQFGWQYWPEYATLDQHFRETLGLGPGNLSVAQNHVEHGQRFIVLAHCSGQAAGFQRLDLHDDQTLIGAQYVAPPYRGKTAVLVNVPWLQAETDYKLWHYLVKAAYIISRRAGYQEVGSYFHNVTGERSRRWRLTQKPRWDAEAVTMDKPVDTPAELKSVAVRYGESHQQTLT